jgi:circadian clock protein KaiB
MSSACSWAWTCVPVRKARVTKRTTTSTSDRREQGTGRDDREQYVLRLYVTGMTPRSTRAVENVRAICEQHLQGRYDLEVIDIYQQPTLAKGEQIIAAPTLIKKLPLPLRRVIGDLSSTERVLLGLDLRLA